MSESIPSRRERRRNETRARLLAVAFELVTAKGYAATSIDDIAQLADVARGTAVNYFPRKEDYLAALVDERQQALRRALEAYDRSGPVLDHLVRALDAHARSYEDDRPASRALVREWLRAGGPMLANATISAALLSNILSTAKECGEIKPTVNPTDAAILVLDAFLGAVARWAGHEDENASLRRPLNRSIRLLMRAFTAESSNKD